MNPFIWFIWVNEAVASALRSTRREDTRTLEFTVVLDGRALDLVVVDYPGEDFVEGLRQLRADGGNELLYDHYHRCDFLLLLFDPDVDVAPGDGPAAQAREERLQRLDALLSAVQHVWLGRTGIPNEPAHPRRPSVAVVLTKSDRNPGLTGPRQACRIHPHARRCQSCRALPTHRLEGWPRH